MQSKPIDKDGADALDEFFFLDEDENPAEGGERKRLAEEMDAAAVCGLAMHTQDAIIITDAAGVISWINPSFQALSGYTLDESRGRRPSELLQGPDTDQDTVEMIRKALSEHRGITCEIINYRSNGTPFWSNLSIAPILDDAGQVQAYASSARDISLQRMQADELVVAHENVRRASLLDPLTELPNRRSFDETVYERHADARRRSGPMGELCLIRIDLDFFKRVNDDLGHAAGDHALIEVARILRSEIGDEEPGSFAARIGGDEFVVIPPLGTSRRDARLICERLQNEICKDMSFEGTPFRIGSSYGLATMQAASTSADQIMSAADVALYEAKELGRGKIITYDEELASRQRRDEEAVTRSRAAVRDWALSPLYRLRRACTANVESAAWPISAIEIAPGVLDGAEIVRGPEEIIQAGAKAGFVAEMMGMALWQALQPIAELTETTGTRYRLHPLALCPLSHTTSFLETLEGALELYPSISLGVTSSYLSGIAGTAKEKLLAGLRARGLEIELHGFGSSEVILSDVLAAQVNSARIRETQALGQSEDLATLIGMAHAMNARVVASDVASVEECDQLLELGCDEVLGEAVSGWLDIGAVTQQVQAARQG